MSLAKEKVELEMVKFSKVRSEISGRKGIVGNTCLPHVSQEAESERESERKSLVD